MPKPACVLGMQFLFYLYINRGTSKNNLFFIDILSLTWLLRSGWERYRKFVGIIMKLDKLNCPNCIGRLEIKIEDKDYIFCPYCGQQFLVDDDKTEYTFNQNINKQVTIN